MLMMRLRITEWPSLHLTRGEALRAIPNLVVESDSMWPGPIRSMILNTEDLSGNETHSGSHAIAIPLSASLVVYRHWIPGAIGKGTFIRG